MKKLSREQKQQKARLEALHLSRAEALQTAIQAFNERMAEEWQKVYVVADEYNDVVVLANDFIASVQGEQEAHLEDKSEKWQESDAGSAYLEWMDAWDVELETCELEEPNPLEVPELIEESMLTELPEEIA